MSAPTAASTCGLKWSDAAVGPHECKDADGHKPGMHSCVCGTYLVGDGPNAQRPPWKFDVPEVPAHVTALKDRVGWLWVREGAGWVLWRGSPGTGAYRLYGGDLLARAPLVECEDPRAAS